MLRTSTAPESDARGELAARELLRVAKRLIPSGLSLKGVTTEEDELEGDENGPERSLPQELKRVASQVLLRPAGFLQDMAATGGARKRASSSGKLLLDEMPYGRLRRGSADLRRREASAPDLVGTPMAGLRRARAEGLARDEESEVMPVWQPKESDRPCLVPPLCAGTAQIRAGKDFFEWANGIVEDVAEDATTANFSLARVPGPPPLPVGGWVEVV